MYLNDFKMWCKPCKKIHQNPNKKKLKSNSPDLLELCCIMRDYCAFQITALFFFGLQWRTYCDNYILYLKVALSLG